MSDPILNQGAALKDANTYLVAITSLSHDGRGVGRVDDKVVFIDGVLPGEEVMFSYRKKRKQHDEGRLIEIVKSSPQRVAPPCEYYGVCGGCGFQHLHIDAQIHEKEKILRDHFTKFGGLAPQAWLPPLVGDSRHYRRKARLSVRHVAKKGGVLVGYREKAGRYVADMTSCLTMDKRFSDMLLGLRELVISLSCYERVPQLEVAAGDEDMALVLRHLVPLTDNDKQALIAYAQQVGAQLFQQPKGPDSLIRLWPLEDAKLSYHLPEFAVELFFRPTDFIQVNADMNRRMVSYALELLALEADDRVLDLFCGLGNFTLPLARCAQQAIGVEANESLLAHARENARHNDIANVEFRQADLYAEDPRLSWQGLDFNKLLLDPPRDGAMEVIKQLPEIGLQRIVYVSCNPVTLARDAQILQQEKGYRMTQAGVMDMFPHTNHVESIAVFEKAE